MMSSRFCCLLARALALLVVRLSTLELASAQTTCFAASGNAALKSAVNDYIKNGGATSSAGRTYGAVLGNWCVSRVTSFAQVFMGQTTFNQPLTNWNTSSATSFAQMFMNATSFNQPLGHFDTRKVTNLDRMFYMARSFTGQGLNNWQTSRVSSLYWTFRNSSMNANISSWSMASATDLRETFRFSPFNNNLCLWGNTMVSSKLPTSRLTNTFGSTNCPVKSNPSFADSPTGPLCHACPAWRWGTSCFPADGYALADAVNTYIDTVQQLTTNRAKLAHSLSVQYGYPIATWCTKDVQNFNYLFAFRPDFNEPLTYWNTSSATDMSYLFWEANSFDQNLSHFDTSKVTVSNHMFKYATSFRGIGVERWDMSQNQQFYKMFDNAWAFNADISGWDVRRGISFTQMFESAESFNRDIGQWQPQLAVDMSRMFIYAYNFNQNLCSWGPLLTNATDVTDMFDQTKCKFSTPPDFHWSPSGPYCFDCPGRATSLPSIVEGPYELPIVPAAITQRPDNTIVAWAGDMPYEFDTDAVYTTPGTFTSTFNPTTKVATILRVENTNHRMFCPGTATLADGRLLITGGLSGPRSTFYNPYNNTWSSGPNMNVGRGYHSQLTLSSGKVFTLGGSWSAGVGGKIGEVYDPATNAWTAKPGIQAAGSVNTDDTEGLYRSDNHMWLFEAPNGKVLHAGPSKKMHWIDLTGNGSVTEIGLRGDDLDSMSGAAALYDINKVFTAGGAEQYDVYETPGSNRAYIIDFSSGGGAPNVTRQPNMQFRRTLLTLTVLPNGNIVVLGGLTSVALFSDENAVLHIEMYNPYTQVWSDFSQTLTTPRPYHGVSLLLKDARVLAGGGGLCGSGCDYSTSWNHPNVEIITPPYLLDANGQLIADRPAIVSGNSTFSLNGQVVVATNSTGTHTFALMRLGTSTHTVNLDQRRVPLTVVGQVGSQFTLQVPASPVVCPPGLYWLFAMNAAGVPSTGWDLRRV